MILITALAPSGRIIHLGRALATRLGSASSIQSLIARGGPADEEDPKTEGTSQLSLEPSRASEYSKDFGTIRNGALPLTPTGTAPIAMFQSTVCGSPRVTTSGIRKLELEESQYGK